MLFQTRLKELSDTTQKLKDYELTDRLTDLIADILDQVQDQHSTASIPASHFAGTEFMNELIVFSIIKPIVICLQPFENTGELILLVRPA